MSFQPPTIQTVPNYTAQRFSDFLDFLMRSKVARPPAAETPYYPDDSNLIEVEVSPPPGFPIGQCWFNCIEHSLNNNGQIVYGWLFWEVNHSYYVAQHHAVWRNENGILIDLTPNAIGARKVLFMPDDRAPFDFDNLKAAMSLEWTSEIHFGWVAKGVNSKEFGIMIMQVNDPHLADRIAKLRSALG